MQTTSCSDDVQESVLRQEAAAIFAVHLPHVIFALATKSAYWVAACTVKSRKRVSASS